MIALLTGKFLYKTPTYIIIECGGVGYEVHISLNTFSAIQAKDHGTLFTYFKVSEDAQTLYGFAEAADFLARAQDPNKASEPHGNAGLSESGLNNESSFENVIPGTMVARPNYWALGQRGGRRRGYPCKSACDQR